MIRLTRLATQFVDYIPDPMESGVLYVSRRFATASHLCCCGCGLEVVTPLNLAKWRLIESAGQVSLYPSIGNWNFPCRSHYWIDYGRVRWAGGMSAQQITAVKERDRRDAIAARPVRQVFGGTLVARIAHAWQMFMTWLCGR